MAQTLVLIAVKLLKLPALLLARPPIGLHAQGTGLAQCRRLFATLVNPSDEAYVRELQPWMQRLEAVPGTDLAECLNASASGQVQAAIADATPDASERQRIVADLVPDPVTLLATQWQQDARDARS